MIVPSLSVSAATSRDRKRTPLNSPLSPYTTLFRSTLASHDRFGMNLHAVNRKAAVSQCHDRSVAFGFGGNFQRSEEDTTELPPLSLHDALPIYPRES